MTKTLTRHGNSLALVIDRGVLDLLNITDQTPLDVTTDGDVLIVTPVRNAARRKAFQSALEKTNKRYGRLLKRLAE